MNAAKFLFMLILLGALGGATYFLYINLPGEVIEFKPVEPASNESAVVSYSGSKQFYENMRYSEKTITYTLEAACDENKKQNAIEAFDIIEQSTVLDFEQLEQGGQIIIACSEIAPEPSERNYFVAGEGGPTEIVDSQLYAVILSGKISLFREEKCERPIIAIHEILHALGFDHSDNPRSVLYPTLNCNQQIEESTIDEINKIYSVQGLADLKIEEIEASKSGPYLTFRIEVLNQGLRKAENVMLSVYSEGEVRSDFELGDIDVGTRKVLTVENSRIPRGATEVTLVVDRENAIDEINQNNNEVKLVLAS